MVATPELVRLKFRLPVGSLTREPRKLIAEMKIYAHPEAELLV